MSVGRSFIRGPRFALRSTEKVRACIKCIYGNGEHAPWCEKGVPTPVPAMPDPHSPDPAMPPGHKTLDEKEAR